MDGQFGVQLEAEFLAILRPIPDKELSPCWNVPRGPVVHLALVLVCFKVALSRAAPTVHVAEPVRGVFAEGVDVEALIVVLANLKRKREVKLNHCL